MKRKIVLSLLLALCVACGSATMGVAGAMTVDLYSVENEIISETVDQTIIRKETKRIFDNRSGLVTQAKLEEDLGDVLDNEQLEQSDHIIVQREIVQSGDYNKSSTWNDPKGYITLYTAAYHKLNYNANYREYTINGMVQYQKNFLVKNTDF